MPLALEHQSCCRHRPSRVREARAPPASPFCDGFGWRLTHFLIRGPTKLTLHPKEMIMKNTSKTLSNKLALNKNTLRQLSYKDLDQAAGGRMNDSRISCIEQSCACSGNICEM
jgi:hypothetical protein